LKIARKDQLYAGEGVRERSEKRVDEEEEDHNSEEDESKRERDDRRRINKGHFLLPGRKLLETRDN